MNAIGIMQGRLTPPVRGIQAFPREHWREEFAAARAANLDFIEWIVDDYGFDVNPLMTHEGIKEIRALSELNGVLVNSICADYFMEHPFLKCAQGEQEKLLETLLLLFQSGKTLGIKRIVLPFVDASAMHSPQEENDFIHLMRDKILPMAEKNKIEVHLETSLAPHSVADMLNEIPHELFWINYDSGNSASLGYRPEEEFAAYGNRIGSFHVKDRVLGGTTVPLGTGNTDFSALAKCLHEMNYQRAFVLQVARSEAGDEVAWAKRNRALVITSLNLMDE
ncbi:MAG: hypothetical protein A3F67_05690 [Verrucomicrobia bacterium RIFCSPHIGHO2_12_FULL_41_10]|nr:MAG: hypothetical protein A3F67_05690 [Verrucomicrobia bacterium RIFCSPHIGHO2_12_FULL_41_10]